MLVAKLDHFFKRRKSELLTVNDTVVFEFPDGEDLYYTVGDNHLFLMFLRPLGERQNYPHDYVFIKLGLNPSEFCSKFYGFNATQIRNYWPSYDGNMRAITDVVRELYILINRDFCTKRIEDHYRRKLIRFMELKQATIGPDYCYFTFDDAMDIMNWDEETAKDIFKRICSVPDLKIGLRNTSSNPFCYYYHCDDCTYAENHGYCNDSNSDYTKLPLNTKTELNWGRLLEKLDDKDKTVYYWDIVKREEYDNHLVLCVKDKDGNIIKDILLLNDSSHYVHLD